MIGLPDNLFFSTGIPVCILVLKKCKKPDDVLFINTSEHFEKGKRQNRLLPEHITKIIDAYQSRKEEKRYARRVLMEEIEANGYNLNISRYISTAVAEEEIDTGAEKHRGERQTQCISQGAWLATSTLIRDNAAMLLAPQKAVLPELSPSRRP